MPLAEAFLPLYLFFVTPVKIHFSGQNMMIMGIGVVIYGLSFFQREQNRTGRSQVQAF